MESEIEFLGFAQDCRVLGRYRLREARLADQLNGAASIKLHDVTVVSLADGRTIELAELDVDREELSLVVAGGPRGDSSRRVKTRHEEVDVVIVGGFEARGFIHCPPSADPVGCFDKRPPMVALTDAEVGFRVGDTTTTECFDTVLVNRDLTRSVRRLSPAALR